MNDVSSWANSDIRRIEITQDYSPNHIVLRVREFVPVEGDKLSTEWKHAGERKEVPVPPYAIESLKESERTYRDYILQEGMQFFIKTLDRKDALVFDTYIMAVKASNSHMVDCLVIRR